MTRAKDTLETSRLQVCHQGFLPLPRFLPLTSFCLLRQDLFSCIQQCWVVHLHRPLCNQGQEEVHVINEVLKAGVGQILWLISVSCCLVFIDVNYTILHLNVVSQVLTEIPHVKGILSILHWRGEH